MGIIINNTMLEIEMGTTSAKKSTGEHAKDLRKVCTNVGENLIQTGSCVQITGDAANIRGKVHSALRGNCSGLKGDVTNVIGTCTGIAINLDSIPEVVRKADGGCHLGTLLAVLAYQKLERPATKK